MGYTIIEVKGIRVKYPNRNLVGKLL